MLPSLLQPLCSSSASWSSWCPCLALRLGPVDFGAPAWLAALLVLIPVMYFWKTSRVPATPLRRRVSLALRTGLILALVLALAEFRLVWFSNGVCTIFLIDQSESVPANDRTLRRAQIQDVISQRMGKEDLFAIIEFAGDSVLSALPSVKGPLPGAQPVSDTARTDIARAVRLAMATFPADRQKRIVLISDGNQNSGDAMREARIASMKNVEIETLTVGQRIEHEIMVESVTTPPRVQRAAQFNVRVVVTADQAQGARLNVLRDNAPIFEKHVQLREGATAFDVPDTLDSGGFHHYAVRITPDRPENDTIAANNTGYGYTLVEAPGKVLLVRGNPNERDYLGPVLRKEMEIEIGRAENLPQTVAGLDGYSCVILENVAASRKNLSHGQMEALRSWVQNSGGGLVLIGGDDSFGPGGYKDTPLEAAAPVDMDVKRKKHLGSLAMVVVLDKSGSMAMPASGAGFGAGGPAKMDLANAGAAEALRFLDENDLGQIGAVDTQVYWMTGAKLEYMSMSNKNHMATQVKKTKAGGGGILCKTALVHAYGLVNAPSVNVSARHVIIFADAADAEQPEDCVAMAKKQYEKFPSVTTSVIGLGTPHDSDVAFLKELARAGHGRFHLTNNAMDLPTYFAKEAFIVHRNAWVEDAKGIVPAIHPSPLMEGFERTGLPKIFGYVGTTLKPRATLAIHGKEIDDPVLAHWNYGLGKAMAYTSDDINRWGKEWVSWSGFSKFWVQAVRWCSRNLGNSPIVTTTTIAGNEGQISIDANTADGRPINNLQLKAKVTSENPNNPPADVRLTQVGPGRYEGRFTANDRGTYTVGVSDERSKQLVDISGAVMGYPPEYRDLGPNAAFLRAMEEATNAQPLTDLAQAFARRPFSVKSLWVLWEILLLGAVSLLLLDIAWRRLNVADWFRPRSHGVPATARRGDTVGAFKQVKTGRAQVAAVVHTTLRQRIESAAAQASTEAPTAAAAPPATSKPEAPPQEEAGYTNALMRAKRRAADQIKDRSS